MTFSLHQKIKLTVDHSGKPLKKPKYGYIISILEAKKGSNGFFTEQPSSTVDGLVYLIQTSCFGGALWYTDKAFVPAGGKNELGMWRDKLAKCNARA